MDIGQSDSLDHGHHATDIQIVTEMNWVSRSFADQSRRVKKGIRLVLVDRFDHGRQATDIVRDLLPIRPPSRFAR